MIKEESERCEFDKTVARLGLLPVEYESSAELKKWTFEHRNQFYVPTRLLSAWKMSTLWDEAEKPTKLVQDTATELLGTEEAVPDVPIQ